MYQGKKKIISPCRYKGTMNSQLFEEWFENQLLQELLSKSVISMDNTAFHTKKQLNLIAQNKDHSIMFLPAYS